MNLFERATRAHRTCGTCVAWHREATYPEQDKKGHPQSYLVAPCHVIGESTRGSDSCGKWTRLLRLNING